MGFLLVNVMLTSRRTVRFRFLNFPDPRIHRISGHIEVHVDERIGHVEKKRLPLIFLDECQGLPRELVMTVVRAHFRIAGIENFPVISPEERRVVMMCIPLIEIAEEIIESLLPRNSGRALFPDPPFADCGRLITGLLKHFPDRHVFGQQRPVTIFPHPGVTCVLTGHKTAAGRGTT